MIGDVEGSTKVYWRGTHRIVSPEETLRRVRAFLPRAGITRLADVTGLDCLGIPVYQAVRPASRSLSVSQGKGMSIAAAKASALMEAIELWHAEYEEELPTVTLPLREMQAANAIPATALPWASPADIRGEVILRWHRAQALDGGAPGWLPAGVISLDFRQPEHLAPGLFRRTSNGLASGNCMEEALLHALCEVVERHSLHEVREDSSRAVPVRRETIPAGDGWEMIHRIQTAGMRLAIYDVTCHLGVPVIFVKFVAEDLPRIWFGSGCHPSPHVALSRALTEAAQSRLTFISGARDDLAWMDDRLLAPHLHHRSFDEPEGRRDFAVIEDLSTESLATDCQAVVDRLKHHGHPAYAVDLSRPGSGIAVARVFALGLREAHHV